MRHLLGVGPKLLDGLVDPGDVLLGFGAPLLDGVLDPGDSLLGLGAELLNGLTDFGNLLAQTQFPLAHRHGGGQCR